MFKKVLFILLTVIFSGSVWAKVSSTIACKSLFSEVSDQLLKTDIDPKWAAQMSNREKLKVEQEYLDFLKDNIHEIAGDFKEEEHNSNYTHEIPKRKVKNQCASGNCWIYAGTNMLEGHLKAKGYFKQDFSFSQNYLYFFSLLEKANTYFEGQIKYANKAHLAHDVRTLMQINMPADGGVSSDFLYLIKKYGLVPERSMPHTLSSKNSHLILSALNDYLLNKASEMWMYIDHFKGLEFHNERFLQEREVKDGELPRYVNKIQKAHFEYLREFKQEVLSGAFKILESHLGTPPTEITFKQTKNNTNEDQQEKTKTVFTPQEFAQQVVKFESEEFVTITDIPTRKRNKPYVLPSTLNFAMSHEGFKILNLNVHRMVQLIQKTIDKGVPVYLLADFSQDLKHESGIMHPDVSRRDNLYLLNQKEAAKLSMDKKTDWLYHMKGFLNHAVIIDAYDRPKGKRLPIKFRIENSWGEKEGEEGYFHMYLDWFLRHGYGIMIPKNMLTEKELKLWNSEVEYVKGQIY